MRIEEKVNEILKVYHIVDEDVEKFKMKSGLRCLRFCSLCCSYPRVTATVLELLPLAYWVYRKQMYLFWLEKLSEVETNNNKRCILLRCPKESRNLGRCTVYRLRPLICRLFGFSAVVDKNNIPRLVTCQVIKKMFNENYLKTGDTSATIGIPLMKRYFTMLYSIDFVLAQKHYPFNEAFRLAIETVLSHFAYRQKGDT